MEQISPSSRTVFDFTRNVKQQTFFFEVMKAVAGLSQNRYFFYGGAIRGGKTAVCLVIFWILAKKYPNSRWYIIRDSFTTLEATTIPSFEKFFPEGSATIKGYNRNRANYYVELTNGSRIFFASESLNHDKDLSWMLGLEANGIMLEQVESLSTKSWEKALERTGSWYIDPMPPGIILATFNPTLTWIKEKVYDPFLEGKLTSPYVYVNALPTDNPFVTEDQWTGWKQMDSVSYARFVEGDWTAFAIESPFLYAFDIKKHTIPSYSPNIHLPLFLSFDFNKEPMTAVVGQNPNIRNLTIFDEFQMKGGSTPEICEVIKAKYNDCLGRIYVTGDATGANRTPMVRGDLNHYKIIKHTLGIKDNQFRVRSHNMSHSNSRMLCNSLLQNADIYVTKNCVGVIKDCINVQVDDEGDIIKTASQGAHLLDNFRYMCDAVFPDFIDKPNKYRQ